MIVPEYEKIRFRYEYGGESIEQICTEERLSIKEVEQYAERNNWVLQYDPSIPVEKDRTTEFYIDARKKMTVELVRRSLTQWQRLVEVEDRILRNVLAAVEDFESHAYDSPGLELMRLTKVLSTLRTSNQIYSEAILTPAEVDKQKSLLSEEGFEETAEKVRKAIQSIEDSIPGAMEAEEE